MAIERIKAAPLKYKTGEDFRYSDVGYIVLGEVVKMVDGRPLDQFAQDEIFAPLTMLRTSYNTPFELLAVPTEPIKGSYLVGKVHDPRAAAMGGVAGHAGLFSTTQDLARYCQMLLNGGEVKDGKRILKAESVAEMIKPRPAGKDGVLRTYGFDCVSSYDSPRGKHFPKGTSFGHTGFTGGSIWIDPESGVYIVLLTSRLHPDGKGDVKQLRSDVATAVAEIVGAR
jgi:serine-type D-Ala-D-Ala carboxypeptidase